MDEFSLVSGGVPLAASGIEYGYVPWDLQQEKAAAYSAGSFPGAQKQKTHQKSTELMNRLDFVVSWLMQLLTIWQLDACLLGNSATTIIRPLQQICPRAHAYVLFAMVKSLFEVTPLPHHSGSQLLLPFMFIRPCQRWAARAVEIQGTVKFK